MIVAVSYHPVRGSRGFYRANLKHGVSSFILGSDIAWNYLPREPRGTIVTSPGCIIPC